MIIMRFILVMVSFVYMVRAQAKDSCNHSLASTSGSPQGLVIAACEIEQRALGCEELVAAAPDLKPLIRDCRETQQPWQWSEVWRGCRDGFTGSWRDLFDAVVVAPVRYLTTSKERDPFLKSCEATPGCIEGLYFKAYGKEPDPTALQRLSGSNKSAELDLIWKKALEKESLERGPKSHNPRGAPLAESNHPGIFQGFSQFLQNRYSRFRCFKTEPATEMACYAVFSVIDPTLVAGGALKLSRLASALRSSSVLKTGGASEAELLDFLINPPGARASRVAATGSAKEIESFIQTRLGSDKVIYQQSSKYDDGRIASKITVRNADDKFVGMIDTAYDPKTNRLHVGYMMSAEEGKGVGLTMFESALKEHPQTRTVTTNLALDNEAVVKEALARGLPCIDAIQETPAYKIRKKAGFSKIIEADCPGGTFSVEKE